MKNDIVIYISEDGYLVKLNVKMNNEIVWLTLD